MESDSLSLTMLFHGSYPTVVGEKLNWRLAHPAGSSSNVHRFTGHETCLKRSEALTINKESSSLKVFMFYSSFHNPQKTIGMSTGLLGMREA
jgi:hypothetical protein